MTDLILSFDSEDYLTPQAADAERWWAEALRERGLRGSFQLVGELVRSLERSGRGDVLDAFAHHEIGYHTDFHSRHPTHPEAVADLSLGEGMAQIIATEAPGLATLAGRFGIWPVSYCSPGDSWTPATLLALARMGLRVFCNDKLQDFQRTPYWYCGMLVAHYDLDFQDFYEDGVFAEGAFAAAVDRLLASAGPDDVVIIYTHPTRLVTAAFWDEVFADGARPALTDCPPAPLRPADEIARCQHRIRGMLDHLVARSDLRFIDFATLYAERAASRRSLDDLLQQHGLHPGEEGLLPLRGTTADDFMPEAVFDGMAYRWLPYTPGFTGGSLIRQARHLAWTAAPAARRAARVRA